MTKIYIFYYTFKWFKYSPLKKIKKYGKEIELLLNLTSGRKIKIHIKYRMVRYIVVADGNIESDQYTVSNP